jgi:hypothetical protein
MREMQSTEVDLSGFNALCTFSHLFHEVYFMSINSVFNTVSVSGYRRPITNETSHVTTHATHSDP